MTPKPSAPEVSTALTTLAIDLEKWGEGLHQGGHAMDDFADRVRDAARRVAELEADAARYRWLRDYDVNWRSTELVVVKDLDGGHIFTLEELDAAIDAARGECDPPAAKEEG